jgi:hypothetical protein
MGEISLPDKSKLYTDGCEALQEVKKYVCRNEQEYLSCANFFKWVKAKKKEVQEELERDLEPKIRVLDQLHKQGTKLRKQVMDPWEKAETAIEDIMRPYVLEKKRKEAEEKRRLEEQAQKAAEEERDLMKLLAQIEGRTEEAAVIDAIAPVAAPVKVETEVPKVEGMKRILRWKWEIVRVDDIPDTYWMLNEKLITATVNAQGADCKIPGIRVVEDVSFGG